MERSLARPFALVLCVSAATLLLVGAYVESLELPRPTLGAPPSAPQVPCTAPDLDPELPQCSKPGPTVRTAEVAPPQGDPPRRRG